MSQKSEAELEARLEHVLSVVGGLLPAYQRLIEAATVAIEKLGNRWQADADYQNALKRSVFKE